MRHDPLPDVLRIRPHVGTGGDQMTGPTPLRWLGIRGGPITVRPTPRKHKASQPCSRCGAIANPEHITDCRLAPDLVGPSISGLCPRCYREWSSRDTTEEPHPP